MGKLKRTVSNWILWYLIISAIIITGTNYLIFRLKTGPTIAQELLIKEQLIARAEASNTITFFERFGTLIASLSRLQNVKDGKETAIANLDNFVEQERSLDFIGGIIIANKLGIVTLNSNTLGRKDTGVSIVDRGYFKWAKGALEGEYFISEPVVSRIGASKGKNIVAVVSPIYRNGSFNGVIAGSVILKPLMGRFFGLMKASHDTEVYLLEENGKVLYNSSNNKTDEKVSDVFSNDLEAKEKLEKALKSNGEGKFNTEKHLIAYSPIDLKSQRWLLVISAPIQEVIDVAQPLFIHQLAIMMLMVFAVVLVGVILFRKTHPTPLTL